MTDRPILFSAPMVRALMAGTKTQTRRVANFITEDAPGVFHARNAGGGCAGMTETEVPIHAPVYARFAVGDRLYVREHWKTSIGNDGVKPRDLGPKTPVLYLADDARSEGYPVGTPGQHRQAMHMPRWASRLTLIVTDVRVERLQDISEADAIAEGIQSYHPSQSIVTFFHHTIPEYRNHGFINARRAYEDLWDSINGPGAWDANPWVVAVSFDVRRGNIDAPETQPPGPVPATGAGEQPLPAPERI